MRIDIVTAIQASAAIARTRKVVLAPACRVRDCGRDDAHISRIVATVFRYIIQLNCCARVLPDMRSGIPLYFQSRIDSRPYAPLKFGK
jgi:hypothetical protein